MTNICTEYTIIRKTKILTLVATTIKCHHTLLERIKSITTVDVLQLKCNLIFNAENLAFGKSTSQSSTFINVIYGKGSSDKAVDGNSDRNFRNGHCSHTLENNPSWWRVDLGSDHVPVFEVRIVNRLFRTANQNLLMRNNDYKITLGEY